MDGLASEAGCDCSPLSHRVLDIRRGSLSGPGQKCDDRLCQVCVQDYCEELEYWGLDDLHLQPCCQHSYYRAKWHLPKQPSKAGQNTAANIVTNFLTSPQDESLEDFGNGLCAGNQRTLWNLFENPHHSPAAKVVAIISCLFVVISTLCLIVSTIPSLNSPEEEYFFEVAEAVFVGWFTFEYIIRFVAAPRKWM